MFPGPMFEYMAEWDTATRRRAAPPARGSDRHVCRHETAPAGSRPGAGRAAAHWLGHRLLRMGERLSAWSIPTTARRA